MSLSTRFQYLLLLPLLLGACRKAPDMMTPAQLNRYIDSSAQAQLVDKRSEAAVQLERRMAIQAKPRADSIVDALTQPPAARDSLKRIRERLLPARPALPDLVPQR